MPDPEPFETHPERYDNWFDRHPDAYRSELAAIRELWPDDGSGLEIGVGTGRFAAPLGIRRGLDPSAKMRERARERGIRVKEGIAEDLPYDDEQFDKVLLTTTLCYLENPLQAFREAERVLRPGGVFVVGFIDRSSTLGKRYSRHSESPFYRNVHFHTVAEVRDLLSAAEFEDLEIRQTLFGDPTAMETPEQPRNGYGEGGFVVVRGVKPM
jgi:SAM-dependent methyltransferase